MPEAGLDRAAVQRLHGKYGSLPSSPGWNRPSPGLTDIESPHNWLLVVLHQMVREVGYLFLGFLWLIRGLCRARRVAPVLTEQPAQPTSSTKTILFIRHGEGNHNRSLRGWKLIDPPLNETGLAQAKALHSDLGGVHGPLRSVEAVIVSPLARAIHTAQGAFGHGPAFGGCVAPIKTHWVITPLLRERMGAPCDEGRPKSQLLTAMPEIADWEGFDTLDEEWWPTGFEWDLYDRIAELEAFIRSRPESTIALVGHGGLFTRILGYHLKNCGYQWAAWEGEAPIAV